MHLSDSPVGIYLLQVNTKNTQTRYEICSKLTIKTPKRRQRRRSGAFIVNFEHISQLVLVSLLLTLKRSADWQLVLIQLSKQQFHKMLLISERRPSGLTLIIVNQHCMKSVRIRSFSGPYFLAFGLNTERYGVVLRI